MSTIDEYVASVPAERREVFDAVRSTINSNVPDGFEEGVEFGMITWSVPLSTFADTYNGRPLGLVALANQKHHLAMYLLGVYATEGGEERFRSAWEATGTKLDMGKSCVRFRGLDDVPLDVVADTIRASSVDALIAAHERAHAGRKRRRRPSS